jgi:hypothetical protein
VSSQQTTKEKKKYGTYLREDSISAIQTGCYSKVFVTHLDIDVTSC